jgi:hypothetical protein
MDRKGFDRQMARLTGLRFVPGEMQTHWEALQDIPDAVLVAAVDRAQKTRTEFPTPIELRQDADAVAHLARVFDPEPDRSVPLPAPVVIDMPEGVKPLRIDREWRHDCDVCADSGMRSFWCGDGRRQSWLYLERCERPKAHSSHEWVRRCECYETNPTIRRRNEHQAKYAVSGAQKKAS